VLLRRLRPVPVAPFDLLGVLIWDATNRLGGELQFLQVGAADGVSNDPLHDSILKHRLRGVLVEPLPDQFQRLERAYSGVDGLHFVNCAIAAVDGTLPLYRVRPGAPLPPEVHHLASFDRRNLTASKQGRSDILTMPSPVGRDPMRDYHGFFCCRRSTIRSSSKLSRTNSSGCSRTALTRDPS
jgi:hypothetical protein